MLCLCVQSVLFAKAVLTEMTLVLDFTAVFVLCRFNMEELHR